MKFSARYIVRAASSQTYAPLEKAQVRCGALIPLHKDGGYYVFLDPTDGKTITISCTGYSDAEITPDPAGRSTVYLTPKGAEPLPLEALAAETTAAGASEIRAAFIGGFVPQVLDGCAIEADGDKLTISAYDSISAAITTAEPLKRQLAKGSRIIITSKQG